MLFLGLAGRFPCGSIYGAAVPATPAAPFLWLFAAGVESTIQPLLRASLGVSIPLCLFVNGEQSQLGALHEQERLGNIKFSG